MSDQLKDFFPIDRVAVRREDKDVEEVSRNEETPPLFGANSQIEKTGTAKRSTTTWFKSLRFPSLFTAGGILYFCLAEQN